MAFGVGAEQGKKLQGLGFLLGHGSDGGAVWFQEGPDTGIGGGGKAPEAASLPQSPRQVDSVPEETGEDEPMVSTEQHGSAGEVLDAETQTDGGTGDTGDGPERGCAALVQGEAAAGGEVALPADTPGSTGMPAEMPDPHCEDGNRGERPGGTDQCQEPPCASVSAEDGEPGTVSERAAGGEHRELAAEGGSAEAENTGAAGTQGGNVAPRKNSGEADAGREEAGGGETPAAGSSSAPDPAVPAGGKREGEGLAEEGGAERPELRGGNGLRLPPQQVNQPPSPG